MTALIFAAMSLACFAVYLALRLDETLTRRRERAAWSVSAGCLERLVAMREREDG